MQETLFQKNIYTAKAKSLITIDFPNYTPNYFRIINMGSGELFFSATYSPTTNRFDMKVPPQGTKMHVEPYGKHAVYVFNNGAEDSDFALLTFNADFEPLALAMLSDESLAEIITSQRDYDGIIRGFNVPLPAGSNNIGSVNVNGSIPSGSNTIGKVDVNTNGQLKNIEDYLSSMNQTDSYLRQLLENISTNTNPIGENTLSTANSNEKIKNMVADIKDNVGSIVQNQIPTITSIGQLCTQISKNVLIGNSLNMPVNIIFKTIFKSDNLLIQANGEGVMFKLISNDGEHSLNISMEDGDVVYQCIELNTGESITDFYIPLNHSLRIEFIATGSPLTVKDSARLIYYRVN